MTSMKLSPLPRSLTTCQCLEAKSLTLDVAEITMMPQNTVPVEGKHAEQVLRLMEALDDQDDVRKAHANFDIPDDVMANWRLKSMVSASGYTPTLRIALA